jgi:hypothetical protein
MKPSMRNKFKGAAKKVIAVNRVRKAKPTMVERHGGVWGFLSFVLFLLWSLPSAIYRHRRWLKANPGAGTTTTTPAHPRRALLQTPTTADVTTGRGATRRDGGHRRRHRAAAQLHRTRR